MSDGTADPLERWRGTVDEAIRQLQLPEGKEGLRAQLTNLDWNFNRRADKLEQQVNLTLEQARLTNGRVSLHDLEINQLKSELTDLSADGDRRAKSSRWAISTVITAVAAVGVFLVGGADIILRVLGS